jgi:hypothetical protein
MPELGRIGMGVARRIPISKVCVVAHSGLRLVLPVRPPSELKRKSAGGDALGR